MNILEFREPEIAINTAINIIEQLKDVEIEKLIKFNELKDKNIIVDNNIIYTILSVKQYERLIKDLELIREFTSEQLNKVIKTELMDKKDNEKES